MSSRIRLFMLAMLFFFAATGCLRVDLEKDAACPPIYPQQAILNPDPDWEAVSAQSLPNGRVAFFDGDPAKGGKLIPPVSGEPGGKFFTWRFEGHDSSRIWQQCSYEESSIVLKRPMPGPVQECRTSWSDWWLRMVCK